MPLRSTRGERGSSAHFLGSHFWNRWGGSTTWSSTLTKRGMSRAMSRPPGSARVAGDGLVEDGGEGGGHRLLGDATAAEHGAVREQTFEHRHRRGRGCVGVELLRDAPRRLRALDLAGELRDDRPVAAAAGSPESLVALLGPQVTHPQNDAVLVPVL